MFGLGMGGFGGNGQYRKFRMIRLGALVLVLVGGTLLGHRGTGYSILRYAYLGLIIGGLVFTMGRRRMRMQGGQFPNGRQAPGDTMPNGSAGPTFPGPVGAAPPPPAGWYPDPGDNALQRYWDGIAWGARRRWNGTGWVAE